MKSIVLTCILLGSCSLTYSGNTLTSLWQPATDWATWAPKNDDFEPLTTAFKKELHSMLQQLDYNSAQNSDDMLQIIQDCINDKLLKTDLLSQLSKNPQAQEFGQHIQSNIISTALDFARQQCTERGFEFIEPQD